MRIRSKPWARPELDACPYFISQPLTYRGHWRDAFPSPLPIHLELGCGKGSFLAQLSGSDPLHNYLGVDIKNEVLGLAKRNIQHVFEEAGKPVDNVRLFAFDIEHIDQVFSPEDSIERIYINFCNPWPRSKHYKKRLTHPRQLIKYIPFLIDGAEIRFKTDDGGLFAATKRYLQNYGFSIQCETSDLHQNPSICIPNIQTEHEMMFSQQGIPIKYLAAVLDKSTLPDMPEGYLPSKYE